MTRPRQGSRVMFTAGDAVPPIEPADSVIGLRFIIIAQNGGDALVDYTALKPHQLALACARALRHLSAPGGPLTVRSSIKAMPSPFHGSSPIWRRPATASVGRRIFAPVTSTNSRPGWRPRGCRGRICSPCW